MSQKMEDILLQIGIEGDADAVTHAAMDFIVAHPIVTHPLTGSDLPEHEMQVLEEGGFSKSVDTKYLSKNIEKVAGEVGVMVATSLSQAKVAEKLDVDPSCIRQRISSGTLYAMTGKNNTKILPAFQFTEKGTLPGLELVLPAIDPTAHPIAVQRFFLTVSNDLFSKELNAALSPRDWLNTGHDPSPVILLATEL